MIYKLPKRLQINSFYPLIAGDIYTKIDEDIFYGLVIFIRSNVTHTRTDGREYALYEPSEMLLYQTERFARANKDKKAQNQPFDIMS